METRYWNCDKCNKKLGYDSNRSTIVKIEGTIDGKIYDKGGKWISTIGVELARGDLCGNCQKEMVTELQKVCLRYNLSIKRSNFKL